MLAGDAPGPWPPGGEGCWWTAWAAIAAVRRGCDQEARAQLRELGGGLAPDAPAASAPIWSAGWMALEQSGLRSEAIALLKRLLAAPSSATTPLAVG